MNSSDTKDGAIIEVLVKPNSQKFEIAIDDDSILVF